MKTANVLTQSQFPGVKIDFSAMLAKMTPAQKAASAARRAAAIKAGVSK